MSEFVNRGLRIVYDDTSDDGSAPSARPMVLLHGWATQRRFLHPLSTAFQTSHRVLNIDLIGHGDSAVPEDEARLDVESLAEDVAGLCDAARVTSAVIAGHSFGGAIALEIAAQRPDLVAGVVALEGILFMPAATVEQSASLLTALRTPAWRDVMAEVLTAAFLPSDDPALLTRLIDQMRGMPQHVVAAVLERVLEWDVESAAKAVGAAETPLLYIEATGGLADLDLLRERCPQLVVGRTVAIGHDQMLETPEQSVAMISAFLAATSDPRKRRVIRR
jgi:pimeloyl-ACP methyl ester carboxylesterase